MPRVTRGLAGFVFAVMLLCPRASSAGIIDFIYELSGSQMIGVPIHCFVDLSASAGRDTQDTQDFQCKISEIHISGDRLLRDRPTPRFRLEVGGGVYISTSKDSELKEFDWFKVQLFAYEPMLHFRSFERNSTTITHGVMGLSYFLLTGSGFKRFDNVGMKFAPVEFRRGRFSAAYTFRVFPNPFTAEQFGAPAGTTTETAGTEVVHGFMVGWRP
jgi:hypothetical protein